MDVQDFEQAILKLAFETDARITTASVAYYLGIPSKQANELLNALLEEGVLELDSDGDGNLYYLVPNQPDANDQVLTELRRDQARQVDADTSGLARIGQRPAPPRSTRRNEAADFSESVSMVSPTDDDDTAPISPRGGQQSAPPSADTAELARLAGQRNSLETARQPEGSASPSARAADAPEAYTGRTAGPTRRAAGGLAAGGSPGQTQARASRVDSQSSRRDLFSGVTQRQAQPDASLDRCGASPVIVSDSVRCEPHPLPTRKPVVASCFEPSERPTARRVAADPPASGDVFGRDPSQATMLAPTAGGELAVRDNQLERPEHQPGMALLLSLILCGTGQIYNGEVSKGIMMMVLCFLLWFVLLGWVVHIWSIVDSVVVAERLNRNTG